MGLYINPQNYPSKEAWLLAEARPSSRREVLNFIIQKGVSELPLVLIEMENFTSLAVLYSNSKKEFMMESLVTENVSHSYWFADLKKILELFPDVACLYLFK